MQYMKKKKIFKYFYFFSIRLLKNFPEQSFPFVGFTVSDIPYLFNKYKSE